MIAKVNYRKLKQESQNKIINMCKILFPKYNQKNLKYTKDGYIIFGNRFLSIRKNVKRHISQLLLTDIPVQISILRWGSLDKVRYYRNEISRLIENNSTDKILMLEIIINYLYSELFMLQVVEPEVVVENVLLNEPVTINVDSVESDIEEEEEPGLTYIINTFIRPLKSSFSLGNLSKKLIAASIVLTLTFTTAKIVVNSALKDSLYNILYFINSPPCGSLFYNST